MEQSFTAGDVIFQQDKTPAHTTKICKQDLQEANINVLDRPGNSPDLNVIENLCAIVKRKLQKSGGSRRRSELIGNFVKIWRRDTEMTSIVQNLIDSMPNRLNAEINAIGGHTNYCL